MIEGWLHHGRVTKSGPNPTDVQKLFSSISKTYDKANDVITFGMARTWRKKLVELSGAQRGDSVLDCATGTGDLALEFKKTLGPTSRVIGTDFCQSMLDLAPAKAKKMGLDVKFTWADATDLPFETSEFDVTSIAYGIRNVEDRHKALCEMARATKPGGRVMILETGDTQVPVLKGAIQLYFKHLVPRLGGWVSEIVRLMNI